MRRLETKLTTTIMAVPKSRRDTSTSSKARQAMTGKVLGPPPSKKGTSNEPKLKAKTMSVAATTPGISRGRVICQKVCRGDAPETRAAASMSGLRPAKTETRDERLKGDLLPEVDEHNTDAALRVEQPWKVASCLNEP